MMVALKFRGKQHSEKARFEDLCEVLLTPLIFMFETVAIGGLGPVTATRQMAPQLRPAQGSEDSQFQQIKSRN